MYLTKLFIICAIEIGRICRSEIMIEISKPDGFTELGKAAEGILTNCYTKQEKTIVLAGDFPGDFVERLSSHQTLSLVLLANEKRSENNIASISKFALNKRHKLHVFVITASNHEQVITMMNSYENSMYDNPTGSLVILGWSPNMTKPCDERSVSIDMLYASYTANMLNANLMCQNQSDEIMIYTSNPFINRAPKPWKLVETREVGNQSDFSLYERKYEEHEGMCENVDFEKTRDLNGLNIRTVSSFYPTVDSEDGKKPRHKNSRREEIEGNKFNNFIGNFFTYVNATRNDSWIEVPVGQRIHFDGRSIYLIPKLLRGMTKDLGVYPHYATCKFLVSQFRGNKSQLSKVVSIVDIYSWIAVITVCSITLIVFKFFLGQTLTVGILNLCRLTFNTGFKMTTPHAVSQIYIACLLCFVVTLQGIFIGKLASLLTHDFPLRQVDSVQDLVDLGYKVWAHQHDFMYFNDTVFDGRRITRLDGDDCIVHLLSDPLTACLTWGASDIDYAMKHNLHISRHCVVHEYASTIVPRRWALINKFNHFLGTATATRTMVPLDSMVDEARLMEYEAVKKLSEPNIMILSDLAFAFAILGIGLGCAMMCFAIEVIVYRIKQLRETRVID